VTKFFEPCHRKYGMDDKYFPNTVRIWENIINVKFPAGSDFGFRSMKAKIKSATI
jgi:hypothetical protein